MSVRPDQVIIGGGISALVAASEAAHLGANVSLLLPEFGVGSGFLPRRTRGNHLLDVGTRLFERPSSSVANTPIHGKPVAEFEIGMGMGTRPFLRNIEEFVRKLGIELQDVPDPILSFRNKVGADFLSTLDLRLLHSALTNEEKKQIEDETSARLLKQSESDQLTYKLLGYESFDQQNVEEASMANHGPTFHRLFVESHAKQLWPHLSEIPASLRQRLWIPFFSPRSILAGTQNLIDRGREPIRYGYPSQGAFGSWVENLLKKISQNSRIRTIRYNKLLSLEQKGQSTQLTLEGERSHFRWEGSFALGASFEELMRLSCQDANQVHKFEIEVLWFEIPEAAMVRSFTYVQIVSNEAGPYRIGIGGQSARPNTKLVSVEFGGFVPETQRIESAKKALVESGIVATISGLECVDRMRVRLVAPTFCNRSLLAQAKHTLQSKGLHPLYLGALAHLGHDTLSEQILQGLSLAKNLSTSCDENKHMFLERITPR